MHVRLAEEHVPLGSLLGESQRRRQGHESRSQDSSTEPAEWQTSHAILLHVSLLFIYLFHVILFPPAPRLAQLYHKT
jgi:hypothetical protein